MKLVSKLQSALLASAMFFGLVAVPLVVASAPASAAPSISQCVKTGASLENLDNLNSGNCPGGSASASVKIGDVIRKIINFFSVIVGAVSVIMVIWGGFKYVTSGGESNNVSSAKNTIIYALVGLIIVALSQFIVQFVLDKIVA